MSCNGCRVLRKGCSQSCLLRACLDCIGTAEAQGHATVFVAKFFGRAGLMSFISNVPPPQRPALFQSLLFEACGRTINPVSGAAGLLWTGNWHLCQAAVQTVLRGGTLHPLPQLLTNDPHLAAEASNNDAALYTGSNFAHRDAPQKASCDLNLHLTPRSPSVDGEENCQRRRRKSTPSSMDSEGSITTNPESVVGCGVIADGFGASPKLLNLFV